MQNVNCLLLLMLLLSVCRSYSRVYTCPNGCQCDSFSMECKHRLLRNVPESLPEKITKLNLLGNRINVIRKSDFSKVVYLKTLQLSNNRIKSIEPGTFDTLIPLTKLRLNRNLIQNLPDGLFSKLKNLQKLDLRENMLQCVNENVFTGLDNLKHLYLDRNKIFWISEDISRLKNLETLHISFNKLNCNCHLTWLNRFIKHHTQVIKPNAQSVLCISPYRLSQIPISSLSSYEFQCASDSKNSQENICQPKKKLCSKHCICSNEGIVKCVNKGLKSVPQDLPTNIIELDLQNNTIHILTQNSLYKYKNLRKILLNGNNMIDIEPGAFQGLRQLTSLYLNANKLKSIRKNALIGLSSLMFLYIHNNEIECLPQDTLAGLTKLYLLHLSDNKLTTLKKETLEPLSKLRYLYLVHNPLNCNCKLGWLAEFLKFKEASGSPVASCLQPKSLHGQPVRGVQLYQFYCGQDEEQDAEAHDEDCVPKISCPRNCSCTPESADCNGAHLTAMPDNILTSTKVLILSYNKLKEITSTSMLQNLPNLVKIDLSYNEIRHIDSDVFVKNPKLKEINLNSNKLKCINNQTFRPLHDLETLKLSDNMITCIVEGSFQENANIKHLTLNRNPLHCNCQLRWMSEWVRSNYVTLGAHNAVLCQSPPLLQGTAVSSLDEKYFQCNENITSDSLIDDCQSSSVPEKSCCSQYKPECNKMRCPVKCRCEATKVDCSWIQLEDIPMGIPINTTELYLDRNNLKTLNESSFKHLEKLKTLVLSYNGITELNKNVLSPLRNLETLVLSFNKLQCIDRDAFKGLSNLKVLILQSNDVATIPFEAFRDLRNLNNIALGQNPFHCDCNIKWLNQFFLERFLDNGISLCASPEHMKLKSIYHSKPTDFSCSEETDDAYITAKCDACIRSPCKNNGKCSLITHHQYKCLCPHPFHGKNCEKRINACFGHPCKNGGICKNVDNFGNYECVCPLGFRGPKCNENIDDCSSNKCENEATCLDAVNGYTCICKTGYRGKFCQLKFSYCTNVNPCKNSGQCQPLEGNDYRCICTTGWLGKNCDKNIDDCKYNECRNNAQCVDLVNAYECRCRPGYVGRFCDEAAWKPAMMKTSVSRRDIQQHTSITNENPGNEVISESVCAYHQCLNDGVCVSDLQTGDQKSFCRCKPGYSGQHCQNLDSLYFSKESYIEISPPSRGFLMPSGNITLKFSTNSSSGLLLYQGFDKKYLSVNLYQGHVRIGYNIGDKVIGPEGYSMNSINDSRPHSLEIEIIGENLTMYLDGRFHCSLKSSYSTGNRYLALNSGIFVGGAPKLIMDAALSKYHLETNTYFIGCLQMLTINKKKVDFLKFMTRSVNVKPGCGDVIVETSTKSVTESSVVDQHASMLTKITSADVCSDPEICKNGGICQMVNNENKKFKCICKEGFAGKACNRKAYICRRKTIKNHIKDPDTACLSLNKVRYRYCDGSCLDAKMQSDIQKSFFHKPVDPVSSRCCQPYKYRTRRIEFKCDTGRQYFRVVHFVRRCKCLPNCTSK